MNEYFRKQTETVVLSFLANAQDVTLFRTPGNIGDRLILAGVKSLLSGTPYQQHDLIDAHELQGDVAIICGSGGFCRPFHRMPRLIAPVEAGFRRVLILPSSFDLAEPSVLSWIKQTRSTVMARDVVSFEAIAPHCNAIMGIDMACFCDLRPFRRAGFGVLDAFRTDHESRLPLQPPLNRDISLTCSSLDAWLETIARHERVRTDRAHVMVAAALMGKRVQAWESSYHKVAGIAAAAGLDVEIMEGAPC